MVQPVTDTLVGTPRHFTTRCTPCGQLFTLLHTFPQALAPVRSQLVGARTLCKDEGPDAPTNSRHIVLPEITETADDLRRTSRYLASSLVTAL